MEFIFNPDGDNTKLLKELNNFFQQNFDKKKRMVLRQKGQTESYLPCSKMLHPQDFNLSISEIYDENLIRVNKVIQYAFHNNLPLGTCSAFYFSEGAEILIRSESLIRIKERNGDEKILLIE